MRRVLQGLKATKAKKVLMATRAKKVKLALKDHKAIRAKKVR